MFLFSAQNPDPFDPKHFGILDPDPDPLKYADPDTRGVNIKYPNTALDSFFQGGPRIRSRIKMELILSTDSVNF